MKKILFSTMIASLLAFVGCQNEELVTKGDTIGKKVILTANIAGTADSRVVLDAGTDNGEINGNPIVNVSWRQYDSENPEKFTVYNADYSQYSVFTQSEFDGSKFEGTFPEGGANCAYYGNIRISRWGLFYDFSEQDGKLSEESVLMKADLTNASSEITFEHLMTILKPTFVVNSTEINNTDITNIVMNGVTAGRSFGDSSNSIIVEPSQLENIYIFLPIIDTHYATGHTFTFTVTSNDSKNYVGSLTISKDINAGYVYTASIELTEVMPEGNVFRNAILSVLDNSEAAGVTGIKFVAESTEMNTATSFSADSNMPNNVKYIVDGTTLEIHTDLPEFMLNPNCEGMFNGFKNWGSSTAVLNKLGNITSIDFNGCINTSKVTSMRDMFRYCGAQTINLSGFNTANVTDMYGMFVNCKNLESLNLSIFNTENVTDMAYMFYGSDKLQSLDLSSFNTANVTSMHAMFGYCKGLTNIEFGNTFFTSNVTNMDYMFQYLGGDYDQNTALMLDLTKFTFTGSDLESYIYNIFDSMNENFKVKVTEEGYNFLNGKISDYRVQQHLVKPDGTPWVTGADDIIPGGDY